MQENDATIILKRRKRGYRDMIRAYGVHVDGEERAKIKRGQTVEIPVTAGAHEVQIKVDWEKSRTVAVELTRGEHAYLYCYPNAGSYQDVPEVVRQAAEARGEKDDLIEVATRSATYVAVFELPDHASLHELP